MENASKALLMAGGILLAMMIMALIVYVGTSISSMAGAQETNKEVQETKQFNKTYEAYNKQRMYGTDVISVVNKANDYNKNLEGTESEYYITIEVYNKSNNAIDKTELENTYKNLIFKCTEVQYSTVTGRVKSMKFIEIET